MVRSLTASFQVTQMVSLEKLLSVQPRELDSKLSYPLYHVLRAHDHLPIGTSLNGTNVNTFKLMVEEELLRALRNGIQIEPTLGKCLVLCTKQ
jgi:hypothetical protein